MTRPNKKRLFVFLALAVLARLTARGQEAVSSDLKNQSATFTLKAGEPVAYLSGPWHFQRGDDLAFSDPQFDDSQWQLLDSTRSWSSQGYKGLSGFAWYRFRVVLPPGKSAISILLPEIRTSYQCFVEGKLVQSTGSFPPPAFVLYSPYPVAVDLPQTPRLYATTLTIALRVWHSPIWERYAGGGPSDSKSNPVARVGRTAEVHRFLDLYSTRTRQLSSDRLDLAGLTLLACAISFALYILRPSEREYLWFGFATLAESLNLLLIYLYYGQIRNDTLFDSLEMFATIAARLAFVAFYMRMFHAKTTWILRIAIACLFIHPVVIALGYSGQIPFGIENLLQAVARVPFECWVILLLIQRSRERVIDARLLLLPVSLVMGVKLLQTTIVALHQMGYLHGFSINRPLFTNPIAVNFPDLAECFFLLAMLALLIHRFSRSSSERDRIASELDAARSLQKVLIPESLPSIPGLSIATAYYPAQEVGGDFYQILPSLSGETLIVLGDVSGKGLRAAMTVSMIVGAIRTLVEIGDSPAAILAGLNRQLCGRNWGFTTCQALRISTAGLLTVANAGHLPPYRNGLELDLPPALPLGIASDAAYPEVAWQLFPGDRLTLVTDGVPEAMCVRELFGFVRTQQLSTQPAKSIADAARRFGQTDDITVLSFDFEGADATPLRSGSFSSLLGQPLAVEVQ